MKHLVVIWLMYTLSEFLFAQTSKYSTNEITRYFEQIKEATERHASLWDKNLYAPILLVDPDTRETFANVQDGEGELIKKDGLFIGKLPKLIPPSNTDITWNGIHWAMLTLPLPTGKYDRTDLTIHELFHRAQQSLGFMIRREDNNHLDQEDGRIYLLLQSYISQVAEDYGYKRIIDEEIMRSSANINILDQYRNKFFEQPHLEIRLEEMNMSFDPKSLIPLDEDEGTVYPKIVLTDNWGVLTVEEGGALLRSDWRWVIVSEPLEITDDKIIGEGWVIELNENYKIEENAEGNYILVKIGK